MVNTDEIKTISETLNVPPFNLKINQKSKKSKEVKQVKTTDGL